jgi:hypothetical protein
MKYAVEMGSGDMTYIPSLIKIGSAVRKLMGVVTEFSFSLGYSSNEETTESFL